MGVDPKIDTGRHGHFLNSAGDIEHSDMEQEVKNIVTGNMDISQNQLQPIGYKVAGTPISLLTNSVNCIFNFHKVSYYFLNY